MNAPGGEADQNVSAGIWTNSLVMLFAAPDLVQVVGQPAVEALHGFLVVGAVAVHSVLLQAYRPVEVQAERGRAAHWAGGSEGEGSTGASTAGVHQGAAGEGGLTADGVTSQRHAAGHHGWL